MTEPTSVHASIVDVCQKLRRAGLVVATEGNVSGRAQQDPSAIITTPTMRDKGELTEDQLVSVDPETGRTRSAGSPSSELPVHLAIYRARSSVRGIVHAHPPYATAFAVAGIPLTEPLLAEAVVNLGRVPIAPYSRPGREELARSVADLATEHDVILMANHGAITLGTDVTEAFHRMETLEHYARIAVLTRIIGGASPLSEGEVAELLKGDRKEPLEAPYPGCHGCPRLESDSEMQKPRYALSRSDLVDLIENACLALCYKGNSESRGRHES